MDQLAERAEELKNKSGDALQQDFMRTLAWYFSQKRWPTGFFNAMPEQAGRVAAQLEELNKQLAVGSKAQNHLALALAVFTFLQVIAAAVQIFYRL